MKYTETQEHGCKVRVGIPHENLGITSFQSSYKWTL